MNSAAGKTPPEDFSVRLGQDEISFILNLKETLDQSEQLVNHALRYQELGWGPLAISEAEPGALGLDFSQPEEFLYDQINSLQQSGAKINLGLPTPGPGRLLVIEIHSPKGFAALDRWGEWRSPCWAHTEDGREQHYYYLPPGFSGPRTAILRHWEVVVFGEAGLVLAPPSTASESTLAWHWFSPPWESPPGVPGQAIWQFLKAADAIPEHPNPRAVAELPSWEEVYQRIEPFNEIIRALLAPAPSFEHYYERILDVALGFLIPDPTLILGLLWHAPRGDLKDCPPRWLYLQNLAATGSIQGLTMPIPERPARLQAQPTASPPAKGRGTPLERVTPSVQCMPASEISAREDEVVLERSRYEAMLLEMTELSNKAVALERRLAEQEERLAALTDSKASGNTVPDKPVISSDQKRTPGPAPSQAQSPASALFREFLAENPDLAAPEQVRMLQFYLKNYIDINPENHGLPFKEKLAMAAKMVRDFLGL